MFRCDLVSMMGVSQPPLGPAARRFGFGFNILATGQIQDDDDQQHRQRFRDAADAGRQFIDIVYEQYRRRSVASPYNENLLNSIYAERRFSTASSVQSDNPI